MGKKLPTGLFRLDKFLKGGIPINSAILVMGKAGTGKSTLCYHIMNENLKAGKSCLFVATRDKPERLIEEIEEIGFDLRYDIKDKRLIFIDCYSPVIGEKDKFEVVDIVDLNTLFITVEKILKKMKSPIVFIFDSLTDLFLRNDVKNSLKFLKALTALIKKKKGIGFFILQEDVHDEKTIASIEYICDGTIRCFVKDGKRLVEIKRMRGVYSSSPILELKLRDGIILREFFRR